MNKIVLTVIIVLVLGAAAYFIVAGFQMSKYSAVPAQNPAQTTNGPQTAMPPMPQVQNPTPSPSPSPSEKPSPSPVPPSGQVSPPAPANAIVGVTIQNFAFNPTPLTIIAGTTVVWTNMDSVTHQIKSATFNSSPLSNGKTFSFTFTSAGTFDYSCAIHPSMHGQIIVK